MRFFHAGRISWTLLSVGRENFSGGFVLFPGVCFPLFARSFILAISFHAVVPAPLVIWQGNYRKCYYN